MSRAPGWTTADWVTRGRRPFPHRWGRWQWGRIRNIRRLPPGWHRFATHAADSWTLVAWRYEYYVGRTREGFQ